MNMKRHTAQVKSANESINPKASLLELVMLQSSSSSQMAAWGSGVYRRDALKICVQHIREIIEL
jgi:hypothetical protein